MKKIISLVVLVIIISCNKEQASNRLPARVETNSVETISASFVSVTDDGINYNVTVHISGIKVGSTPKLWLIFSGDSSHVNDWVRLVDSNGNQTISVPHTSTCFVEGSDVLYVVKGMQPTQCGFITQTRLATYNL